MSYEYKAGATSIKEAVFLQDPTATNGDGKTGLAYNTASLSCYYARSDGTGSVAVTLANITTLGTYTPSGFKEIDATNMPGVYAFYPPDAAFTGNPQWVEFFFKLAGTIASRPLKFRLVAYDPDSALATPTNITSASGVTVSSVGSSAITRASFSSDTGLQTIRSNTAQAGASLSITLDASASATNDFYKNDLIYITGGTGAGQARYCTAYNGTSKVATVGIAWATNPDATSTFAIIENDSGTVLSVTNPVTVGTVNSGAITRASFAADTGLQTIRSNTAQAGASSTITLDSGASVIDDFYKNTIIYITGGTGVGQGRIIASYVGATKVATLNNAWKTNPDATSTFAIIEFDSIPDSSGVTTLLSRISSSITISGGKVAATIAAGDSTDVTTLLGRITSARAGYLDNLNVGGAVASHADILAINQSASKHVLLQTTAQYERPESGSTTYTVEARTFSAVDGSAVNADSNPTLTGTGQTTGSLAANIGVISNPSTGVYRWTYTVSSTHNIEPIRFDVSAVISASTFTLSCYSQVTDMVSQTWTSTDASHLTSIFNKLPTNNIADQTLLTSSISNPVTLATSQPNYAPAKAGDAMTLTAAYDLAKTAAQAGDAMTLTAAYDAAKTAAQATNLAACKTILDAVNTMLELNGSVYRLTTASLVNAPGGSGGGGDPLLNVLGGYASNTAGGALQRIGTAKLVVTQPYDSQGQEIDLIRGDDYSSSESRSFDYTNSLGQWPDLTAGACVLTCNGVNYACDSVNATTLRIRFTAADTAAMSLGTHAYYVRFTKTSNSHKVTIMQGSIVVSEPDEITT